MKEHRVVLDQDDYDNLVSGKEVLKPVGGGDMVRIILSDIGFHRMEAGIEYAKAKSGS